jgi:predicted transcriptional regulator
MTPFTYYLDDEYAAVLKQRAEETGASIAWQVRRAIKLYLASEGVNVEALDRVIEKRMGKKAGKS